MVIATASDGLDVIRARYKQVPELLIDKTLEAPKAKKTTVKDFRRLAGNKGAALCAITYWLRKTKLFDLNAFKETVNASRHAEKLLAAMKIAEEMNK